MCVSRLCERKRERDRLDDVCVGYVKGIEKRTECVCRICEIRKREDTECA